jgi:DoxX-like family
VWESNVLGVLAVYQAMLPLLRESPDAPHRQCVERRRLPDVERGPSLPLSPNVRPRLKSKQCSLGEKIQQTPMKAKTVAILYWVVTALFLLPNAGSGIPEAFGHPPDPVAQTLRLLAYPLYLARVTGTAKILGAVVIGIGRFPKLREWAYAGYSCLFLGATASHLLGG